MLGLYPDTLNGVILDPTFERTPDGTVKDYDINSVRGNVRLGNPRKATQQGVVYPGNPDAIFLTQLSETYPDITHVIDQQLYDAKVEYEQTHGTKFYEDFAQAIHRPVDNVNFYSIFRYADDILTTKANGLPSSVNLSKDLMDNLSVYYGHYFGDGLFRDTALTRAFAHPFLSSVAHELQLKMEDDQTGKWANNRIHELKHSVYLGNHLTLLASLHLFNEVEDYHVDFNDELRFQLYKDGSKYFVRTLLNERPLRLEGTANGNGEAEWNSWRDYICSKLYYGDHRKVRSGKENPAEHIRLTTSCGNFLNNAFNVNDKVILKEHERAPMLPDEPTPVPEKREEKRSETAPSILINNMDEGVRSQSVDINAGRTSQEIQYGYFRPVKLRQTQSAEFDIPMKHPFKFENLRKTPVRLNQYRKIKIEKTTNTPINLAERHSFNFGHDLLKTKEVVFNNVDLIRIPQMVEKKVYLADRHPFNWGENPSLTTQTLQFNHHYKIKIPQTVTEGFALPEKHTFNYNSNSLNTRNVNFNHIRSVRVKQAESYDVNLEDFRFESLSKDKYGSASHATAIDTQFNNNPVPKIDERQPKSSQVSLGGNVKATPDYTAPIRIRQEYNPYSTHTTADKPYDNQGSYTSAPEPAPTVPEYTPPVTKTERNDAYPRYNPEPKQYPSYSSTAKTSSSTQTKPASTSTSTSSQTSIPRTTSRYPSYNSGSRYPSTSRQYGRPYGRQ